MSRHWHDIVRLDDAGFADQAFADRALAQEVAAFKAKFFRAKDKDGNEIDYTKVVTGGLQLVPTDTKVRDALAADYKQMTEDGILLGDAESFDELMKRCEDLQKRANA